MNILKIIEQKIKFRNCIINFKKYLDNLDDSNRHYIINDMNQWINLYKNNNKSNNTNVNNFYNHISNNSNLICCSSYCWVLFMRRLMMSYLDYFLINISHFFFIQI